MKQLVTLVSMQLRDKIDLSWIHDKKLRIRNIVLGVTKFIVISILIFLLLKFSSSPPSVIFYYSESPIVMTLVLTLSLVLSVISCTSGLMKNLYFSEDNKVLITFPVNANKIFLSKLVVYFVYEVKRAFSFLIPISFSCVLYMFTKRCVSFYALLYMWIPLLFVIAFSNTSIRLWNLNAEKAASPNAGTFTNHPLDKCSAKPLSLSAFLLKAYREAELIATAPAKPSL